MTYPTEDRGSNTADDAGRFEAWRARCESPVRYRRIHPRDSCTCHSSGDECCRDCSVRVEEEQDS